MRRRGRMALVAAIAIAVAASALGAFIVVWHGHGAPHPGTLQGSNAPDATVAWSIPIGATSMEAVLAVPRAGRPVVVAIPPDLRVDLAGQPEQAVGELGAVGPRFVEAAQAVLGRRVRHFLVSDEPSLAGAVDGMRGIRVEVEVRFDAGGRTFGSGLDHLDGAAVAAYLVAAPTIQDQFLRWQDVLQGFFAASARLRAAPGVADGASAVAVAMRAGRGADVIALPTATGVDGGVRVDARALGRLVATRIRTAGGPLVRVVVINGSGIPGVADSLAWRLAPLGYQVVAAENDSQRDATTRVLASGNAFVRAADRLVSAIGAGSVYFDDQPTGLADVTIVVGKDLSIG